MDCCLEALEKRKVYSHCRILQLKVVFYCFCFLKSYGPVSPFRVTKTMPLSTLLYRCFNMHILNSKPRQTPVPQARQPSSHYLLAPDKAPRILSPSQSFPPGDEGLTEGMPHRTFKSTFTAKRFRQVVQCYRSSDEGEKRSGWVEREISKKWAGCGLVSS